MKQSIPHPDRNKISVYCAVITVSDTRSKEGSLASKVDGSGQLIQELLKKAGHHVSLYKIVKDEPTEIKQELEKLNNNQIQAVIFNGGTGIAPRDTTYDVLENLLEKTLPGFGEIFRFLSYQEIGSRAIASRATAGIYQGKIIFSLPGSTNAVKLGLEKLILPELIHLVNLLN